MSKFSQFLDYLLKRRNESISSLARNAGVERTSIHKALTGERVLSYTTAKKLASYLCLSPQETQTFFQYHSMQLQGETHFELRQQIIQLLNTLSRLPSDKQNQKIPFPRESVFPAPLCDSLCSGAFAVRTLIRQAIDRELGTPTPSIRMNLSVEDSFLLNYIYTAYQQYETELQITHIIPFHFVEETSGAQTGLSILTDVLSLTLSAGVRYKPYFFYDKSDCFSDPFPFYILTSQTLLCISRNFETVHCVTQPELLQHYRRFFDQTLTSCSPLLSIQNDPFEILAAYANGTSKNSYYTFMPQPCLGRFYSSAFIAKKIRKECRSMISCSR